MNAELHAENEDLKLERDELLDIKVAYDEL